MRMKGVRNAVSPSFGQMPQASPSTGLPIQAGMRTPPTNVPVMAHHGMAKITVPIQPR